MQVLNTARNGKFHDLCSALFKQKSLAVCLCGRYGEVILGVEDPYCWPLPLLRGGRCREVKIRANVWIFGRDEKTWPLQRGGRCREVAISRGSTVFPYWASDSNKIIVTAAHSKFYDNPVFFMFFFQSLRLSKQLIRDSFRGMLHEANEKEAALLEERWLSEECMQAIMNFMARKSKL